ncbi:MAG: recombination protein RecR [Chlorobi bacterium]|nr:MAG: recombinational DNA repair protein [Chlorobi bacterium OLB7]MBK8909743.1 recombination protein RecR [Chlorobiota bacterium]MCE7935366.1 recombination protein RecR [Chlorobi bacterium CHB2]
MLHTSQSLESVIEHLSSLPTIGRKTAQRIALYLLKQPREEVVAMARALVDMKDKTAYCSICQNITEQDPCAICQSPKRDRNVICVVGEPSDVLAVEKTNDYHGLYHVLGGVIHPLDGVGPDDLKIKELLARIGSGEQEVILALNPNVEGEMTTLYLAKLLKPLGVKVTRIARGVPLGSALEFVDEATISRALEGRVEA